MLFSLCNFHYNLSWPFIFAKICLLPRIFAYMQIKRKNTSSAIFCTSRLEMSHSPAQARACRVSRVGRAKWSQKFNSRCAFSKITSLGREKQTFSHDVRLRWAPRLQPYSIKLLSCQIFAQCKFSRQLTNQTQLTNCWHYLFTINLLQRRKQLFGQIIIFTHHMPKYFTCFIQ